MNRIVYIDCGPVKCTGCRFLVAGTYGRTPRCTLDDVWLSPGASEDEEVDLTLTERSQACLDATT